jgi:hypothetical protein
MIMLGPRVNYAIGGRLFGFTEVGIHVFELAYWLSFSTFAIVALRAAASSAGKRTPGPYGVPLGPGQLPMESSIATSSTSAAGIFAPLRG